MGYSEGQQANRDNYTWGIQGELAYELADNLSVNYLGSYRKFIRDESFSLFNGSAFNPNVGILANVVFPGTFEGDYRQNSQELRLAYSGDKSKGPVGWLLFPRRIRHRPADLWRARRAGTRGFVFGFPQDPTISKSVAAFGQATYSLTDALRITGGIRYTKDDKSRIGAQIFHANLTDPLDFTTGVQPGTTNPNNRRDSANNASVSYGKTTWRAGLEYDLNDQTLLYATVSSGYKAGGFNGGCVAGTPNCFAPQDPLLLFYNPESLKAYEVGFKTRFADNKVRLSGNYFHYDYSNLQVTQVLSFNGVARQSTNNAGAAKIDGVELEGSIRPVETTIFNFNVNWLNARYSDYAIFAAQTIAGVAFPAVNFAGRKLDRSPEWTLSAGMTQIFRSGMVISR